MCGNGARAMVSQFLFLLAVVSLSIQRLYEMRKSRINEIRILENGGREHASGHYIWMKILHASWLICMPLEVFVFHRVFSWWVFLPAFLLTISGQILRMAAMHALKDRWTTKIMTIPGAPPVYDGIFQKIRHPNYVGVVLEIFAFPLMHSAFLTSGIYSVLNLILLAKRIKEEEKALSENNRYGEYFGKQPRFIPKR